jgi:transposase-like protein
MKRIAKARYTEEFKVAAVQLIAAGRRPAEVAREIGVVECNDPAEPSQFRSLMQML